MQLALFPVVSGWSKTLDVDVSAPPGFDGPQVFLSLEDGRLVSYDLIEGRELWSVDGGQKLAPSAGDSHVFLTSDTSLRALDAKTGQRAWETPLDQPASTPITAAEGWTFVTSTTGNVIALRTADGTHVWSRDVASPAVQSVTIAGTHVYVPVRDGRVLALNVEDGGILWERRLGGAPQPVLALGDRLYVGSDDNYFYCLRTADGRVEWRWQTGGDIVGRAAFDDERVYFTSKDNVLRALDQRSGAQRWKKALPLRPTSGPVAVRGTILVSGLGPSVQGFLMRDGAAAGDFDAGGLLAAPPHSVDSPHQAVPVVVSVTRSLTAGSAVGSVTRSVEPRLLPLAALPNPVPVVPLPGAKPTTDETAPAPVPPIK